MMIKNQYQKSFGETSKPHANNLNLANDYYVAGKGANGVTYCKKEVYTNYVRVIQGLINLPSTNRDSTIATLQAQETAAKTTALSLDSLVYSLYW